MIPFQGGCPLTRRENSFRAHGQRLRESENVTVISRPRVLKTRDPFTTASRCGNINPLPFRSGRKLFFLRHEDAFFFLFLPIMTLGSTDPWPTAVPMEAFSTSVLQGLTGVFATTTKI